MPSYFLTLLPVAAVLLRPCSHDAGSQAYKSYDRKWLKAKLQELLVSLAAPKA